VLSILLSTVAYFVAHHYIKRYLEEMGAPKGFTRSATAFSLAIMIAYGTAYIVDRVAA
jgi:hypothetical protein